jgi:hypothetical protein
MENLMDEFKKYQHVERYGAVEVAGINYGTCYIFPKIDGTNGVVWNNDGLIACGSRKRELTLNNDNQGFMAWVLNQDNIRKFIVQNDNIILYGEWLVPHTLKTYRDNAWRKYYVFDVWDGQKYVSYDEYSEMLDKYGIEYIPPIAKIENPSYERFVSLLDKNTYLIGDGKGCGEGIVIKNYDYKNKFGEQIWAKIVRTEFKEEHTKTMGFSEVKEKKVVEFDIVEKYVTETLIEKEYSKIAGEMGGWSSKYIPRLLNVVYYCLIKEESWNFIKEYKNPIIDYDMMYHFVIAKIKETKSELF